MPSITTAASTPTLVPMIAILQHSTHSIPGTSALTVLFIVICVGAGNALTAEGGRAVFAFARDEGLPFSGVLARVESKRRVPAVALVVTVGVQMALESIYLGTVTGFNTVISIATEGFCESRNPLNVIIIIIIISRQLWGGRRNLAPLPPTCSHNKKKKKNLDGPQANTARAERKTYPTPSRSSRASSPPSPCPSPPTHPPTTPSADPRTRSAPSPSPSTPSASSTSSSAASRSTSRATTPSTART